MNDRPPAPDDDPQRSRDRQLALLIETVSDYAIFMLDPTGHVMTWNRGAERLKGYTAQDIVGRHFSTFYTPEDLARDHPAEELEIATAEGRFEEEGWRIRKDGSRFWAKVVITALRESTGELIGFGKVTQDLTARRLNEEQLRSSAHELEQRNAELHQFQLLVASVRDYAIFLLDPGGYVTSWNAGAERLKGYTPAEAIGRHFSIFYRPEDRAERAPARSLERAGIEGHYETEGWRVRKDGSVFWADVVLTALRNEQGVLVGYAKVTRDLSERRAAEEQLEQFASAAAHDLQEPLRTVKGFVDVLARRYGSEMPADAGEFLHHIGSSTERMQRLLTGLLAYARNAQRDAATVPVDLRATIETVLTNLEAATDERGVTPEVRVPAGAAVLADPAGLEVLTQNVLVNALKFADAESPVVSVEAVRTPTSWRVTIADNGAGIRASDQERIFSPFVRLTTGEGRGSGLGLAIAQRVVARHGGAIGVDSAPGEGSRFWFELPAADGR